MCRIINGKIVFDAIINEKNVYGDVSYTLKLAEESKLAFGMKVGATFHDIGFLNIPQGFRRWVLRKIWLEWPVKRSRFITTVSVATRNEIMMELKMPLYNIRVIPNPVFEGFETSIKAFNDLSPL